MQPLFYLTALPTPPYTQCKEYTLESNAILDTRPLLELLGKLQPPRV